MPNVLFNPWVRWNTWPGLGREFFRRRRRRRRRRPPKMWKNTKRKSLMNHTSNRDGEMLSTSF